MASIDDRTFDSGLSTLSEIDEFHVCSQEPLSYAQVATYSLGNKSSPTITVPEDRGAGGRQVRMTAISDGSVTADGTVTHYALIDTVNLRLRITGDVDPDQAVVSGATFTFPETVIAGIADPT